VSGERGSNRSSLDTYHSTLLGLFEHLKWFRILVFSCFEFFVLGALCAFTRNKVLQLLIRNSAGNVKYLWPDSNVANVDQNYCEKIYRAKHAKLAKAPPCPSFFYVLTLRPLPIEVAQGGGEFIEPRLCARYSDFQLRLCRVFRVEGTIPLNPHS
jgi:hypothetical protein